MGRLKDKVAIVTGAAGGMGLSTVKLFLVEGAKVVATDIQKDLLEKEMGQFNASENLLPLLLNVGSEDEWNSVVEQTIAKFGKIDILVNNAGINIPRGILDTSLDQWNKVMTVNATGVFLGMQKVIPHMLNNGLGSIVNISSIAAFLGGDGADGGAAGYSASKGAVRSISKHAAQKFAADNIRVNTVHPGPIFTPIMEKAGFDFNTALATFGGGVPLPPHIGTPEDIAYGVLYLASDESKFVTGEELVIDGGYITR
ncbi:SDR family NAD(P)-dependent oxidoreductase [Mucilaginibacter lappiensis]|uniref:SDR family NAD(P)-dependent oxidoreductase n=1 Tax=Mucilaginibacter lappiensis TaxID=354630 RepID=UPI003D1AA0B1